MNVKEASEYLSGKDFRCSAKTVRALVKAGALRCYRGPSRRGPMQFPPEELDRFLRDELIGGAGAPEAAPAVKAAGPKREKPAMVKVVAPDWRKEYEKVKGA